MASGRAALLLLRCSLLLLVMALQDEGVSGMQCSKAGSLSSDGRSFQPPPLAGSAAAAGDCEADASHCLLMTYVVTGADGQPSISSTGACFYPKTSPSSTGSLTQLMLRSKGVQCASGAGGQANATITRTGMANDGSFAFACCSESNCNDDAGTGKFTIKGQDVPSLTENFLPNCTSPEAVACTDRYANAYGCHVTGVPVPPDETCAKYLWGQQSCLAKACACDCVGGNDGVGGTTTNGSFGSGSGRSLDGRSPSTCEKLKCTNRTGSCSPGCNVSDINDGTCQGLCMTASCHFDGGDCLHSSAWYGRFAEDMAGLDQDGDGAISEHEYQAPALQPNTPWTQYGSGLWVNGSRSGGGSASDSNSSSDSLAASLASMCQGKVGEQGLSVKDMALVMFVDSFPNTQGSNAAAGPFNLAAHPQLEQLKTALYVISAADADLDGVLSFEEAQQSYQLTWDEYTYLDKNAQGSLLEAEELASLLSAVVETFRGQPWNGGVSVFGADVAAAVTVKVLSRCNAAAVGPLEAAALGVTRAGFRWANEDGDDAISVTEVVQILTRVRVGGAAVETSVSDGVVLAQLGMPGFRPAEHRWLVLPDWQYETSFNRSALEEANQCTHSDTRLAEIRRYIFHRNRLSPNRNTTGLGPLPARPMFNTNASRLSDAVEPLEFPFVVSLEMPTCSVEDMLADAYLESVERMSARARMSSGATQWTCENQPLEFMVPALVMKALDADSDGVISGSETCISQTDFDQLSQNQSIISQSQIEDQVFNLLFEEADTNDDNIISLDSNESALIDMIWDALLDTDALLINISDSDYVSFNGTGVIETNLHLRTGDNGCSGNVLTTDGSACVFPFTYSNASYLSCTTVDYNGVPWCATTNDYPKDLQWGVCVGCAPTDARIDLNNGLTLAEFTQLMRLLWRLYGADLTQIEEHMLQFDADVGLSVMHSLDDLGLTAAVRTAAGCFFGVKVDIQSPVGSGSGSGSGSGQILTTRAYDDGLERPAVEGYRGFSTSEIVLANAERRRRRLLALGGQAGRNGEGRVGLRSAFTEEVMQSATKWTQYCGATLIHPKWLLTAAGCVAGKDLSRVVNTHTAVLGGHGCVDGSVKARKECEAGITRARLARVVTHPLFAVDSRYDVALIELEEEVLGFEPAALDDGTDLGFLSCKHPDLVSVGWWPSTDAAAGKAAGSGEGASIPLRKQALTYVNVSACRREQLAAHGYTDILKDDEELGASGKVICARPRQGFLQRASSMSGTCFERGYFGQDGGALLVPRTNAPRSEGAKHGLGHILVGVIRAGVGLGATARHDTAGRTGKCMADGLSRWHVRVAGVRQWILAVSALGTSVPRLLTLAVQDLHLPVGSSAGLSIYANGTAEAAARVASPDECQVDDLTVRGTAGFVLVWSGLDTGPEAPTTACGHRQGQEQDWGRDCRVERVQVAIRSLDCSANARAMAAAAVGSSSVSACEAPGAGGISGCYFDMTSGQCKKPACTLKSVTYETIVRMEAKGQAFLGGLGFMSETTSDPVEEFGVWACVRGWNAQEQRRCDVRQKQLACFRYGEIQRAFEFVGTNDEVKFVSQEREEEGLLLEQATSSLLR